MRYVRAGTLPCNSLMKYNHFIGTFSAAEWWFISRIHQKTSLIIKSFKTFSGHHVGNVPGGSERKITGFLDGVWYEVYPSSNIEMSSFYWTIRCSWIDDVFVVLIRRSSCGVKAPKTVCIQCVPYPTEAEHLKVGRF